MTTAIALPHANRRNHPSLLRQLGALLAALCGGMRAEAGPAAPASCTNALEKDRTQWVERPMAREIVCTQGTLWLTFDGVPKDIVLEAGQSYRCDSASRLAIHALDAARFEIA